MQVSAGYIFITCVIVCSIAVKPIILKTDAKFCISSMHLCIYCSCINCQKFSTVDQELAQPEWWTAGLWSALTDSHIITRMDKKQLITALVTHAKECLNTSCSYNSIYTSQHARTIMKNLYKIYTNLYNRGLWPLTVWNKYTTQSLTAVQSNVKCAHTYVTTVSELVNVNDSHMPRIS